ncbi:hypothetical protein, partial [Klebsiella oxytoca]|uniref:hypothetical protein n=1 Tax=Klebsiella oxytoca TaxID=571 RepID=UPI00254ED561
DAQHRLREIQPLRTLLPGAALNAPCPGYGFIAVCGPGASMIHRRLRAGNHHDLPTSAVG